MVNRYRDAYRSKSGHEAERERVGDSDGNASGSRDRTRMNFAIVIRLVNKAQLQGKIANNRRENKAKEKCQCA